MNNPKNNVPSETTIATESRQAHCAEDRTSSANEVVPPWTL